jgi:hypothetical protein
MNASLFGFAESLLLGQSEAVNGTSAILQNDHFVLFGCLALILIVPSLAHYWHLTRVRELEASLKHEMLVRGFSAEEIASVMSAGAKSARKCQGGREAANSSTNSPQSVQN